MTEVGPWVLIAEGGDGESRAAVAALRSLAAAGYQVAVTESAPRSLAGASRWCARRIPVPHADLDPDGFANAVRKELASRPYITTFPATDAAVLALGLPVRHLLDKAACATAADRVRLPVPPTMLFQSGDDLIGAAGAIGFPVVVKPAVKRFAARLVTGHEQLTWFAGRPGPLLVQPWLADRLRGILGVMWRDQLVAAVHLSYDRVWPAPCGTIAAATTVAPDERLESSLTELLAGYDGLFHADLAGPYLLDVNPRIHASLPAADAAGAPLLHIWCSLNEGSPVRSIRGRPGIRFRFLEGDLRSIWWHVRHRSMTPAAALVAMAPRRGTVHSYASFRDPRPATTRARFAAGRLLTRGRATVRRPTELGAATMARRAAGAPD